MEEHNPDTMEHLPPDPLLKSGAYIDPHPPSNGKPAPRTPLKPGSDLPPGETLLEKPDWLPDNWIVIERVRSYGASAGTKDKYYVDTVGMRRFRSKKEVLAYLDNGSIPSKRKKPDSDADTTPKPSAKSSKKKKMEMTLEDLVKRFNFNNVPAKVKWELEDAYEGSFRPLLNSTDRVPELTKQEWAVTFRYLTLQNSGNMLL